MARLVASFRFNLTCLGAGHWPARLNPTTRALQSLSTRVPALPKTDRSGAGACPDVPRIWQSVSNHVVPSPLRPASQVAQPPFYRRRRHGVCCRIHRLQARQRLLLDRRAPKTRTIRRFAQGDLWNQASLLCGARRAHLVVKSKVIIWRRQRLWRHEHGKLAFVPPHA
jgi:hypothetical protein